MTIRQLIETELLDEFEQVVLFCYLPDSTDYSITWMGHFCKIPEQVKDYNIMSIGALSSHRIKYLGINNRGWTGIWFERTEE